MVQFQGIIVRFKRASFSWQGNRGWSKNTVELGGVLTLNSRGCRSQGSGAVGCLRAGSALAHHTTTHSHRCPRPDCSSPGQPQTRNHFLPSRPHSLKGIVSLRTSVQTRSLPGWSNVYRGATLISNRRSHAFSMTMLEDDCASKSRW